MTITLKTFAGVAMMAAIGIAAVATTAAPADAAKSKPVVRDHRTPSPWRFREKKKNPPTVVRDNRSTPTWQPKTTNPRWPHYPHKH